jgi:hypothetical protein
LCSSDMHSPTAGHYMYQEMVVEAEEGGSRHKDRRQGRPKPFYLEIDLSSSAITTGIKREINVIFDTMPLGVKEFREMHRFRKEIMAAA